LQGILAVYEQFKGDDKKKFEEAYSAAYTLSKALRAVVTPRVLRAVVTLRR
jgi:hypothetical protein